MSTHSDLRQYVVEASNWDTDRVASIMRHSRYAWAVAAVASACALAASLALVALMPLKRVEPYVIRVDSSTGVADVVPAYAGGVDFGESVSRYFLGHYVLTCERFNLATAESDYEECGSFHGPQRNQQWASLWSPSNPVSPLVVHRDGSFTSVRVESISFFKRANGINDLAQVRYQKLDGNAGDTALRTTHWIATVQYAFFSPSADASIRRWNPLGFKVLEFAVEPEVIGEESRTGPSTGVLAPKVENGGRS